MRCFVLQFPSQSGQEDLKRVTKTRWGQATGAEEDKNGGQAAGWESGGIINVCTEVSHVVMGVDTRRRSPMNEGRGPEARTEPGGCRGPQLLAQVPLGLRFKKGKDRLAGKNNREK